MVDITVQAKVTKLVVVGDVTASPVVVESCPSINLPAPTPFEVEISPVHRDIVATTGGVQGPRGPAGANAGEPVTVSYTSGEGVTLYRGQPVTLVGGLLRLARGIAPFGDFVGLVYDVDIVAGANGRVQVAGLMQQPALEWELATGMVGGLSAESDYYLAVAGGLSPYAPTDEGQLVARVGYATSNTEFIIEPGTLIEL